MKKTIRLEIIKEGGQYSGGVVTDPDEKENIINSIKNGSELYGSMDFDDGSIFESSDCTDILGVYGPMLPGSKICLSEVTYNDKDDRSKSYKEYLSTNIDETEINQFQSSSPYFYEAKTDFSSDDLVVFAYKREKRIHYSVLFEVDEKDGLDLSNVYIGALSTDDTINGDEIVEDVLYIPKDKAIEYCKEHLDESDGEDFKLIDYLQEIYDENEELREKIRDNHLIENDDIEGKGEWENDYVKVIKVDGELLYEGGEY